MVSSHAGDIRARACVYREPIITFARIGYSLRRHCFATVASSSLSANIAGTISETIAIPISAIFDAADRTRGREFHGPSSQLALASRCEQA